MAQLICDLNNQGKATKCRILANNGSTQTQALGPAPVSAMPSKVDWNESDPVVFDFVSLRQVDSEDLLLQYPYDMRSRLRIIPGARLCRGIYEAIFINQKPGYTVAALLRAQSTDYRYVDARAYIRLVKFIHSGVAGTAPDMLVEIILVNTPQDINTGSSILAMESPISISFLGLFYETKRYIYNMNASRLDQCFNIRYDLPLWSSYEHGQTFV